VSIDADGFEYEATHTGSSKLFNFFVVLNNSFYNCLDSRYYIKSLFCFAAIILCTFCFFRY